jgi:hypothetical protein
MAKRRKQATVDSPKSLDEIFAIKDQAAFMRALGDRVQHRWGAIGYDALARGEQLIIRLNAFVGEVNTNGFDGLLFNCTGDWAHEIHEDLLLIGATKTAKLVEEVMSVFPRGRVPKDESSRRKVLLSLAEKKKAEYDVLLDRLSMAFSEPEPPVEDFPTLVSRYARKARAHFEARPAERGAAPDRGGR